MPLADGAKAQDESAAIFRRAGLVRMPHDARVEQGRSLEGVLVEKIRADQPALSPIQFGMRRERFFHVIGARFESIEQVSVTTIKIFKHVAQLLSGGFGIQTKNSVDNIVGSDLIGCIEVSGLGCRFERSDDDSG